MLIRDQVEDDRATPTGTDAPPSEGTGENTSDTRPADARPVDQAGRRTARRVFWSALVVFFLLPAAWALITPYDGAYDEHDHVIRAAGVVRGEIFAPPTNDGKNGRYQSVPASLIPPNFDCLRTGIEPATCLGTPTKSRGHNEVHTRAGHYNPFYYAIVGWPLLPFPDMTGVYLARMLSSLLCAVLYAFALVTIWPLRRRRMLMVALLLVFAPTTMVLTGLVNPNGLEIASSAVLWVTLTCLLSRNRDEDAEDAKAFGFGGEKWTKRLVWLTAVAGVPLALNRPLGVVLAGAIVVLSFLALGRRHHIRELLTRRDVRFAVLAIGVAAALAFIWSFAAQVGTLGTEATPEVRTPVSEIVRTVINHKFDYWIRQTIGVFGYATAQLPVWFVWSWGLVIGFLVLTGITNSSRRLMFVVLGIPAACLAGGLVVDVLMVPVIGYFMQGRYFMPLWMGMFFLAAQAIPPTLLKPTGLRRLYGVWLFFWGIAVAYGLYLTVKRYEYGNEALATYPRGWRPVITEIGSFGFVIFAVLLMAALTAWYLLWKHPADSVPERSSAEVEQT
ncbi:hypothetical protein GCM10009557_06720 [Virgisporangium ochraceum]|uniref:DUF2142 domain-containing protein n=1 Tax=Virgisporangium ochraceum TaxID=65505 RepID=A0A8J4A2M0_9ACTN|nr:DUF2142 domain-containing protein [Virgisporangium ochraceum]GIJ74714.1 hypothetical protein Voc01_096310 [Virgisporangium ochraceum]